MSQDHDPLDETLRFQPIDPYNIGPDTAGAPLADVEGASAAQGTESGSRRAGGVLQRLGRLGAPRLVALGAGLVIVAGGVAWGASAALGSGKGGAVAQAQNPGQNPADGGPTAGTGKGKKAKNGAKAARVTITKVDAGSFTGTDAKGAAVTVVYGDDTKFGTKARPLSPDQLQVGMTVTVAGTHSGDKITALAVVSRATDKT
jgi:hypothetical protein